MPSRPAKHKPYKPKAKRHERNRQEGRQYNTGSKTWQHIRVRVLVRDLYRCRINGKGCLLIANEVDHIDGDSNNNPPDDSNYQSACKPCHSAKTMTELNKRMSQ